VLVAMMVASVLTGLPGGMIADRLGPTHGLALGSWARAAVACGALVAFQAPGGAIIVALAYSAASQVFSAAELACIRHLDGARPARGHAILVILQYAGQGVGLFLLAPMLYFLGGIAAMVAGAVVFYAAVGLLAVWLALHAPRSESVARAKGDVSLGPTLRLFGQEPSAAYAAGVLTFFELVLKAMVVAIPVLIASELHLGHAAIGSLAAATIAGGVAGFWWAATMRPAQSEEIMRPLMLGTIVAAGLLAVASHASLDDLPGALVVAGLAPLGATVGLCLTLAPIAARAVLTHRAPIDHQARVFATQGFGTNVVVMFPLALAGIGTELAGSGATFWFLGITGLLALAALETLLSRTSARELPAPAFEPID
jgi:hypothetical protein